MNTDQLGIELKPHSNRTWTYRGEKSTWASVSSTVAATHSFTIQPIITMDGSVIDQLYVCLKESTGHINKNLEKKYYSVRRIFYTYLFEERQVVVIANVINV